MSRRAFGILATVVGSAIGTWWWTQHRSKMASRTMTPARERGTVIFDNTPTAAVR
jgi:hypothetical protein